MDHMHLIGTKQDQKQRLALGRADTPSYRAKIANARQLIYGNNLAVDSAAVERLLKPESLVPTEVWFLPGRVAVVTITYLPIRILFPCNFPTLVSTYSPFLL